MLETPWIVTAIYMSPAWKAAPVGLEEKSIPELLRIYYHVELIEALEERRKPKQKPPLTPVGMR